MQPPALTLRPHHVLCMNFYEGKGYDGAFTENAGAVLRRLRAGEPFTVTPGPDALCAACPNLTQGLCRWQKKVLRYDERAAALLQLKEYGEYTFNAFPRPLAAALLPEVCADCEWYALCAGKETFTDHAASL